MTRRTLGGGGGRDRCHTRKGKQRRGYPKDIGKAATEFVAKGEGEANYLGQTTNVMSMAPYNVIGHTQQYNVGEKPTVILCTYINRHAGTPEKQQKQKYSTV